MFAAFPVRPPRMMRTAARVLPLLLAAAVPAAAHGQTQQRVGNF
jgi:hypothetical protein